MNPLARVSHGRPGAARRLRSEQSGFTIIEVLVAALILAIVSAGAAVAFVGAIGTSGIQRNRTAAEALAQQNASRLRGYTINQLANLNTTLNPVTIDGTSYTVQEKANFVSDGSGTPSCTNPSADYLQTTSIVSWQGEPVGVNPVTVTGLLTPTAGQISSSAGVLAVQVQGPSPGNTPFVGMPVSVSLVGGNTTVAGVTAANGCVLFADLPVGNYSVSVIPASGSYVDAGSDQSVTASSPDTATVAVSSGSTAASAQSFVLATPGSATFTFADQWPTGVAPTGTYVPVSTAPSVVLASGNLTTTPSYVVCSNQDSACPAVGKADTSWGSTAWAGSPGSFTATPLAPYSYNTYAGLCQLDDPTTSGYGGAYTVANVTAGANPTVGPIKLPSMVIRLWNGTGISGAPGTPILKGTQIALPAGAKLVVTDTGCGEPFVGNVAVPAGDSYLPIDSNPLLNATSPNDTGLLGDPGMPYGKYTICYSNNNLTYTVSSLTNLGNGEIINLYSLTPTGTGTCAT